MEAVNGEHNAKPWLLMKVGIACCIDSALASFRQLYFG